METRTFDEMLAQEDPAIEQQDATPAIKFRFTTIDQTIGYMHSLGHTLQKADRAIREYRNHSRLMAHDPDIVAAMLIREYAVLSLDWSIEPEDPENAQHVAEAGAIEKAMRRIRNLHQMMGFLSRAYWTGSNAAFLRYDKVDPIKFEAMVEGGNPKAGKATAEVRYAPYGFTPVSGDSMMIRLDGSLAVRVNLGSKQFQDRMVVSPEGQIIELTEAERASVVLNVWGLDAADFEDSTTVERAFLGRGLRDRLIYAWIQKQTIEQHGMFYAERLAKGTLGVPYRPGSDESKKAALEAIDAFNISSAFTYEYPPDGTTQEPFRIFEPAGTGYQIFGDLRSIYTSALAKAILAQELMTGTAPTGLGSGVAEAHKDSFDMVVEYDARTLADAMTHDLVLPMTRFNWPDSKAHHQFKFADAKAKDEDDIKIERAKILHDMGVELSERELRQAGGWREPKPDEPTVRGGDEDAGGLADLFGGVSD